MVWIKCCIDTCDNLIAIRKKDVKLFKLGYKHAFCKDCQNVENQIWKKARKENGPVIQEKTEVTAYKGIEICKLPTYQNHRHIFSVKKLIDALGRIPYRYIVGLHSIELAPPKYAVETAWGGKYYPDKRIRLFSQHKQRILPSKKGKREAEYILVHEIGHYNQHRKIGCKFENINNDIKERYANKFAGRIIEKFFKN
ncbi:MAG: hypothetical protein AB1485_00150 [Candidatus Thermoplasmatota archaeon]